MRRASEKKKEKAFMEYGGGDDVPPYLYLLWQ
jgi:hypothetical protein